MNFLTYLLQSAACAAMLWLAYYLLVRKETCYVFNRFYLLAIIPVSIVAPLLQFPLWPAVETAAFTPIFDIENIIASAVQPVTENVETAAAMAIVAVRAFPTAALLLAMYGLGAAYLLFRFGRRLYKLYRFSAENSFKDKGCGNAFTFFRKIYINRETFNSEDYAKILLHEQTHAQQLHSLDLVLAELFAVFQFFNPFAWLLKKSLAEAHEYYADAQVLARYPETNKYQQLLYDQAIGLYPEYVSGFNYSLTKKRFIMMTKTKRSHWLFAKLLGLLVITSATVVFFSCAQQEFPSQPAPEENELCQQISSFVAECTPCGVVIRLRSREILKFLILNEDDHQAMIREIIGRSLTKNDVHALNLNCRKPSPPDGKEITVNATAVLTKGAKFYIEGLDQYSNSQIRLLIQDKYGEPVFTDDNYQNGSWEATDVENGAYTYHILVMQDVREGKYKRASGSVVINN